MTALRPNLLKLLAPIAAFGLTLALLLSLGGRGDVTLPQGSAGIGSAADYVALAEAELEKARDSADPSYLESAGRIFDASLRMEHRNVDALLGAGTVAGLRHEFAAQLHLGLEARRVMPGLAAPYAVIADGQIELGRYGAAERTLQRLLDLKPNLTSYSRVSYLRELTGDLGGAVAAMRLAVSAGGEPADVAYAQTLLGDLELQRGRAAAARLAYTGALRSVPGYPGGLVGLARVDAAGGDLGRAAARLRRAAAQQPHIGTMTLLAQIEDALGRPAAAKAALDGAREGLQDDIAAGTKPDAEFVLLRADHGDPRRAVALGRQVWERAPSIRSAHALGWAHVQAGDYKAGAAWTGRALETGSRDPLFNLHAAVALEQTGRVEAADRHRRIARRGRPALAPASLALLEDE